jgi:anti-anti-sigma factor
MQSTFLSTEVVQGKLIARLLCEKVAERESSIITGELTPMLAGHGWRVAIDMSEVMLLASVGLGALVTLNKSCKANSGRLAVYSVAAEIMEVMKITRLDKILSICPDRDSAIKALA